MKSASLAKLAVDGSHSPFTRFTTANLVGGAVIQRIQVDRAVLFVKGLLLIRKQRSEHKLAAAGVGDMVPVDGNVPSGCLVIRLFQGKQRPQLTLLPGKAVGQVIVRIIRQHDGVVDIGAGDFQPGHEIRVLGLCCC